MEILTKEQIRRVLELEAECRKEHYGAGYYDLRQADNKSVARQMHEKNRLIPEQVTETVLSNLHEAAREEVMRNTVDYIYERVNAEVSETLNLATKVSETI